MMTWLIENLEPALVTSLVSALAGGFVGFRIGISKKQKMSQKAGNNSNQYQAGRDVNIGR